MVTADDMVLVHAVAEARGFAAAGRELGMRRQSVSERVARVERDLGVRLFERTTRQLRLTEAGHVYVRRCAEVAAAVREASAEVRGMQQEPIGLLTVSAPVLFGRHHLGPLVAELLARHPGLRIHLRLSDRFVDLVAEGVDVAIRVRDPGDASLVARRIGQGVVHLVASPAWLARHGPVSPEDLAAEVCILQRPGERWTVTGREVDVGAVLVVDDIETACAAAVAGVGVAQLPAFVSERHVAEGRLVRLFDGAATLTPPIFVVFPSRHYLPVRVRVFVEAVAEVTARAFPPR